MERKPVASGNLKSIGHEQKTRTLQVEYHSGSVWNYTPVTESEYDALMQAESIGSHFAKHIRDIKISEKIIEHLSGARPPVNFVRRSAEKGPITQANSAISLINESRRFHEIVRDDKPTPPESQLLN